MTGNVPSAVALAPLTENAAKGRLQGCKAVSNLASKGTCHCVPIYIHLCISLLSCVQRARVRASVCCMCMISQLQMDATWLHIWSLKYNV